MNFTIKYAIALCWRDEKQAKLEPKRKLQIVQILLCLGNGWLERRDSKKPKPGEFFTMTDDVTKNE